MCRSASGQHEQGHEQGQDTHAQDKHEQELSPSVEVKKKDGQLT